MVETLRNFYNDIGNMVDIIIENPYIALLITGFLILFTTIMLMITRNNYTRIVKMIDKGEEEAIEKRIEEWGEMIINNVQQECMERKLSLTLYIFILPVLSLLMIVFSIYKLNLVTNIVITVIHVIVLVVILYILKSFRKKKNGKSKTKNNEVESKD